MTTKNTAVAVANNNAIVSLTKEELLGNLGLTIQDIKNSYAKGATDAELAIFLDQAAANNLDPRKREIYFVKYGNSAGNCITGYQTYIQRADRSGLLDGWSAELMRNNNDAIIAARVTIHRKDWEEPFVWTVERAEFDSNQSIWKKSPGFMLKKVCIAQAFRLCFPNELGAMPYTSDELSTFTNVEPTDAPPPVAAPVADKPKAAAKPAPKAAPKAAAKPVANKKKVIEAEIVPEEETDEPPVVEEPPAPSAPEDVPVEAEEVTPEPPADALSPAVVAKIGAAFASLGISSVELQQVAGDSKLWGEKDRVALLASFKGIKAGKMTKEGFLKMAEQDF